MRISALIGIVSAITVPAVAADAQSRFVDQVQTAAAWSGIEVRAIGIDGNTVLAKGVDRLGRKVVFQQRCGTARITCPHETTFASVDASDLKE